MGNIWDNYYNKKKTIIGTVNAGGVGVTGIIGRVATAQTSLTATVSLITTNLTSLFNTVKTNLNTAVDSVTNPTTGMIAGLNCKLFGEDFIRINNSLCVSMFNVFYSSRLILGVASYGILFAMCCIVCSGVRH